MWNNLSRLNKILIIATIVVIPIAIFITVLQVQERQTIKQRASEQKDFGLEVYPSSGSYTLGQSINIGIRLANNSKDVSGIDFTINYDANVLRFEKFDIYNPGFTTIINNTSVPGKIHYAAINSSTMPLNSVTQFDIGTLTFTGINATGDNQVTDLSFSNPTITAANFNDRLAVSQGTWQYAITSLSSSVPTAPDPTSISEPTSTPILIPTNTFTPPSTPNPILACSCGAWETTGACGTQGCESNSIPQFRSCTSSCPNAIENRCLVSGSCTPAPTSGSSLLNYCYQSCSAQPEDDRDACYDYCYNKYGQ